MPVLCHLLEERYRNLRPFWLSLADKWSGTQLSFLVLEVGSAAKAKLPWGDFHGTLKIIPSPKLWAPSWFGNVYGRFNLSLACSWRDCSHGMESFLLWECTKAELVFTCLAPESFDSSQTKPG